jgi:phosphoserine phosphatase RsbU/P
MQANEVVFKATPTEIFATVFFAILDRRSGRLVCASAGHPAAALTKDDGTFVRLTTTGTILGAFPEVTYRETEACLGLDDLLFLYTDGLTEARRDGELYGEERLFAFLSMMIDRAAPDVVSAALAEVTSFAGNRLRDDLAILALRRVKEDPKA